LGGPTSIRDLLYPVRIVNPHELSSSVIGWPHCTADFH